jgi:hypothetical protein|tara:strand:- start:106 stop:879 length:774 start_codon:yes stop_codon:yes gene_type:complete
MELILENFRKFIKEAEEAEETDKLLLADDDDLGDEEEEEELTELNPYHDKKTGKLSSAKAGNTYSLSKPAVDKAGWDDEKAKKGIVTSKGNVSYKFGMAGTRKGCGRKSVSGEKIPKKYSCSDYSKEYGSKKENASKTQKDQGHPLVPSDDNSPSIKREKAFPGSQGLFRLAHGIAEDPSGGDDVFISLNDLMALLQQMRRDDETEERLMENDNKALFQKCKQMGLDTRANWFGSLVKSIDVLKRAQDGKLYEPTKK